MKNTLATCSYCGHSIWIAKDGADGWLTVCVDCKRRRRELNSYLRRVEAAAKRFYRLVRKGVI
jgi:hypothetical protein